MSSFFLLYALCTFFSYFFVGCVGMMMVKCYCARHAVRFCSAAMHNSDTQSNK
jgi:hypothetical protein